jgi:hypothetical protein
VRSICPSPLPLGLRLLNKVGEALQSTKVLAMSFDEGALLEAAVKTAGRDDFSDPYYREGLGKLVESVQESDLTFIGRLSLRQAILDSLVNRLLLVEARTKKPEMFQRPLHPPRSVPEALRPLRAALYGHLRSEAAGVCSRTPAG